MAAISSTQTNATATYANPAADYDHDDRWDDSRAHREVRQAYEKQIRACSAKQAERGSCDTCGYVMAKHAKVCSD